LFQINLETVHDSLCGLPCGRLPRLAYTESIPDFLPPGAARPRKGLVDHLVLTVIAPDKAGQVERIAQCIADHGGNWLESRMSRMAGQFAGILRVAVPAENYDELVESLQGWRV
jgi:predicted amino acid-binding ACT domain protein